MADTNTPGGVVTSITVGPMRPVPPFPASEMVRRVANAIAWLAKDRSRNELYEAAYSALAAMREPTEKMTAVGERASLRDGAHDCEVRMSDVYRAMIDAALGE